MRRILPKGGIGAELGVQRGDFTRELLEIADPERLHLVDLWYLWGKQWHWGVGNRSTVAALKHILDDFEDELVSGKVALNIGDDLEILSTFPDRYLDWVYLDTLHAYEHTKRELEILTVKVKLGGIIAGDDWRLDPIHPHHGISKAVTEFVATEPYELIYASEADLQWAVRYAA